MHLLQIYKLFPFREDLEEFVPLAGTLLDEKEVEPQQWLLALHLAVTWPERCDASLIMREIETDAHTAHTVLEKVKNALSQNSDFYTQLVKSLGSCMHCG